MGEGIVQFSSLHFSSVQFSRSVVSDSLRPHESQHARPPCVREFVMDMYILLYLKWITNKDLLSPPKSPPIQGSLGKNGYMYMYA